MRPALLALLVLVAGCPGGAGDDAGAPDAPADVQAEDALDAPSEDAPADAPSDDAPLPPGDAPGDVCAMGARCATLGARCTTASQRCTCEGGVGLAYACEPIACPEVDGVEGASCAEADLRCDTGFEDPGQVCVGPELVWATCRYYHRGGALGPPNGCPPTPPTIGAPCCQGLPFGGPPPGCAYGSDVYDCVGQHWSRM